MAINIIALCIVALLSSPAWADRRRGDDDDDGRRKHLIKRGYERDDRHRHYRYYPRPGYTVRKLPRGYRVIPHRRKRYYFYGGIWYHRHDNDFVVIRPPIGVVVPILPRFYTTIWYRGIPYYYAGGVYYVWREPERAYVVTEPPPERQIDPEPIPPDRLFIYPKQGQSEAKQAEDRYQCYRWSVDQTGFDPTRPGGNVNPSDYPTKRIEYDRAMRACLEAKDYSVK